MPDLTEHATWRCTSNTHWMKRYESNSTRGKFYSVQWGRLPPDAVTQYGYTCDCWPFKKGGKCSHVRWAEEERCRWNWEMEVGAEPSKVPCGECGATKTVCPGCGGNVEAQQVAV